MGLDIIYYRNLSYVKPYDENEDPVQDFDIKLHVNPDFPERADDIEDGGMYNHYGQEYHFRVGPYSYYNAWRNRLAKVAGYKPDPRSEDKDAYSVTCWREESGPFWELICFSDCEGTIGSKTSKRIHEDFRKYRKAAEDYGDEEFLRTYSDFEAAFATASDNGAVVFC